MISTEVAERAAAWWARAIARPVHSGLSPEERTRPENSGYQLAELLMTIHAPRLDDATLSAFENELRNILLGSPVELGGHTFTADNGSGYASLSVDYDADLFLSAAAHRAGIKDTFGLFPIKTHMWIQDRKITVRAGYGAESVEI